MLGDPLSVLVTVSADEEDDERDAEEELFEVTEGIIDTEDEWWGCDIGGSDLAIMAAALLVGNKLTLLFNEVLPNMLATEVWLGSLLLREANEACGSRLNVSPEL